MVAEHDSELARAILETVTLPLLTLDADLRVETANEAFLDQFQVSRPETLGTLVYDLGNGQWDIPELRRLLGEILPEKRIVSNYRVEHDFERIGRRTMHLNARRVDRSGRPALILLAISDDTEREAAQAELDGRIELADKLIGSVREGLLILDQDLRVQSASSAFYERFAVQPEKTIGHLVYELGNGQWDIPELRLLLGEVLPRQRSFDDFEVTHTFEGIGERVMLLNGRRLDHMDLILLAIRDVTDLRQNATRLEAVTSAAHVGVFEDDRRAGRLFWSPEMRSILGYPKNDPAPIGETVPDFVHPEDRASVSDTFARVTDPAGDGALFHEHRIIRPDGETRWVQMKGKTEFAEVEGERRPVLIRGILLDVTERRTAEEALRERERRLRNVLDGMGEAFGLMDHDLRIITQNEAALELDGRPLEDIRGRTHWEVYPGSERSELGRLYKKALKEQVPVSLEHRYTFPHDGTKWLEMRAFPVPEGLAVFWRDITERKDAEAALRDSESRLRKVLDMETVGVVFFDLVGGVLDANDAYLSMIGYSRAELEKGEVRYERLTPPDWRWRDEQTIAELKADGKAGPFEKQYTHKDGSRIWVECVDKMLDDGTAVEIIIDVTERKRAEADLRESEDRYRALVSSTSDVIYRMSPDWSEMRELGGRGFITDTHEPRRDWMTGYIPREDQPLVEAAIRDTIDSGNHFDLEHRILKLDGSVAWVRSRAVPLTDEEGRVLEWFGAASDVTARKRAEEHQNVLMGELDHRVKNILAVVQSIARQSLGRGKTVGPDAAERLVGRINALAQSHALLARSRWQGADFGDLVENTVAPYRGEEQDRVAAAGPELNVTPKAAQTLTLALHELVTNAGKYGALSQEGGRLEIKWELSGEAPERRLKVKWVERGGPPIEQQPSRKGFGSRLIRQILSAELDGEVAMDFDRAGLRVQFDLPLANLQAQGGGFTAPPRNEDAPIPEDPASLEGKRVLVVEDEQIIGQDTVEALRSAGCSPIGPIGTVDAALRLAVSETFDAAVLDLNLNGEMAWPAARALRAREIPFVFTTGYAETVTMPRELKDVTRIEKPFNTDRLVNVLAAELNSAGNAAHSV
ncbi:PAS domain S-box protein [Histidinibacterium aquaticum]|uniref:histidine kinase n=1 Tax=Histidinibacterium aquaticum TaxID=2613962 RepID=A0A5J5GMH0_9RHOB|nr:PAS domain S-box protein [Histidinibacterium aquaticum]KAA9008853.1 PAS domain S-box protein [Histidinibacterium aquaticum]